MTEFESLDSKDKIFYRMTITSQNKRSVDMESLESLVTKEVFDHVVKRTTVEVFKCQPVKSRKKLAPQAPSEK